MVGTAGSLATARRAAIDAMAASWTIESEEDGYAQHLVRVMMSHLDLRALWMWPACAGRASSTLSRALMPGQRRRRRRLDLRNGSIRQRGSADNRAASRSPHRVTGWVGRHSPEPTVLQALDGDAATCENVS